VNARMGRVSFSSDKADDVISHVREEIVPKYEQSDGFKGFTLLLDRSGGVGVGISFWESEDAMQATDGLGDQARQGAAEAGSGDDKGMQHFEVAIDTMA
jgi:heme-degrading monooxygenase HmoA